jgi:hypothetical protein
VTIALSEKGAFEAAIGKGNAVCPVAHSATDKSVMLETALPWAQLGLSPDPAETMGFDLFWTDIDLEEQTVVAGTLRWAGGASDTGYLWLRE